MWVLVSQFIYTTAMDGKPVPKTLAEQMRHHADEARQHLTTIQLSLNQL